jgi:hypothetical protein
LAQPVSIMRRNRFILIVLILFFTTLSQAQKRYPSGLNLKGADEELWNFGIMPYYHSFRLNYELTDNKLNEFKNNLSQESFFGLRLTSEYTLTKAFNLRFEPGFILNKTFYGSLDSETNLSQGVSEIQLPIILKYQGERSANFNPFIILGYSPSIKLLSGIERDDIESSTGMAYNKISHSLEFGLGIDFYLTKGKLGIHARVLNELRNYKSESENPLILAENIKWRGIMLGVSFETKDGWKLYAR